MSINSSSSSQGNESRFVWPGGQGTKIFKKFGNELLNLLGQQGTGGLGTPLGLLGPVYANLFGDNPTGDYLGARGALQDTLSGKGLDTMVSQAYNQLLPSTLNAIGEGSNALRAAAGPLGLRFSTDLAGQQGQLAQGLLGQLGERSLQAGMGLFGQRAQSAQSIFDLIGQLGQQNNPLAAIMAFAQMGGPQLGEKGGGRSHGSSASVGS